MRNTKKNNIFAPANAQTNHKLMELNKKEMYCCPEARVFEVKIEGVICESETLQDYNWHKYEEE